MLRLRTIGDRLPADALERARLLLAAGGLVVYPTETFYGFGCDPRRPGAVARLLRAKGRADGKPLPLIAASAGAARGLLRLSEAETDLFETLARAFWPGPLTLIAAAAASGADRPAAGVAAADDSLAVRVSSHPAAVALAGAAGGVIVSTSANPAGAPPPRTPEAIDASLLARIDLLVDGGPTRGDLPSTVVDLRGGTVELRRSGAIDGEQVRAALAARR